MKRLCDGDVKIVRETLILFAQVVMNPFLKITIYAIVITSIVAFTVRPLKENRLKSCRMLLFTSSLRAFLYV